MKMESSSPEPSMDEILASIRHIISSDESEEVQKTSPAKFEEDILDLTNLLPDEKPQNRRPSSAATSQNQTRSAASPDIKVKPLSGTRDEPFLSSKTISETVHTLRSLNTSVQASSPSVTSSLKTEQSIESLVGELLKPLLKEWLDNNLPRLVQRIVAEQIEELVSQAHHNPSSPRFPSTPHDM